MDVADTCGSCDGPVTWVDDAWMCPEGCTYCTECSEALTACPTCSQELERVRRTRPIKNP